jgi:CubicO group peptidase (beta-lactamase class C family)
MWIASCTKLLASICALQCVERGQITLDEDVSRVLPEFASPQIVSLDEASPDGFKLTPAKNKVTLRHLLTHTSGNAYEWGDPRLAAWRGTHPKKEGLEQYMIKNAYDTPLLFEPGEGWVYGGSVDWAGEIAARLNNTNLKDYMEEHIFTPLGIKDTTFVLSDRPDLKARLMWAEKREADGSLSTMDTLVFPEQAVDYSGGGGLWSCGTDYIKVLADLLQDSPKILKRDTVLNLLIQPQIKNDSALSGLVSARTATAANAAPADAGMNYGLGGMILTADSPLLPKGTLSWGGLPNLKWFLNVELGVAGYYGTQVMPHGDAKATWLSGEFFKEVLRIHKAS